MQVRKQHEEQGIKPAVRQPCAEAKMLILRLSLGLILNLRRAM